MRGANSVMRYKIKIPSVPGIYTITNVVNGKIYVGYTTDLCERRGSHYRELRKGIHSNERLQNAYNKYGEDVLIYEVLWECEEEYLASNEHYWCIILDTHNRKHGYNIKPTDPARKNPRNTDETNRKIGAQSKGRRCSEQTKEILRKANIGKKQSEETIRKRIESIRKGKGFGHALSEETKEIIRKAQLGRKHSPEQIENRVSKTRGRKQSEEERKKRSKTMMGNKNGQGCSKIIEQYKDDILLKEWQGLQSLKDEGYNVSDVSEACNNKRCGKNTPNKYKEYTWKYKIKTK